MNRKQLHRKDRTIFYQASITDCRSCAIKSRCTQSAQRTVSRHLEEDAMNRMHRRATPELIRLRRSTVEHPFATLKYPIFGRPRLLLRALSVVR